MTLKPNASPEELSSPFFKRNQEICEEFEAFIERNSGKVNGVYNASSYSVLCKFFQHPNQWAFELKKSTFTSGNLLLSSAYQNLHLAANWTAVNLAGTTPTFRIHRKRFWDFVWIQSSKKWHWFSADKKFLIKTSALNHPFIAALTAKLDTLIKTEKIWEINCQNTVLSIDLRSGELHFSILESLLAENYA